MRSIARRRGSATPGTRPPAREPDPAPPAPPVGSPAPIPPPTAVPVPMPPPTPAPPPQTAAAQTSRQPDPAAPPPAGAPTPGVPPPAPERAPDATAESPTAVLPSLPSSPASASSPPPGGRGRTAAIIAGAAVLALAIGFGAGWLVFDADDAPAPAPVAPTVVVDEGDAAAATEAIDLGFPGFATLSTTRVGGADPTASAAGAALAAYPAQGPVGRPRMITLVPADSWQAGIAAAALSAPAIGAPVLISGPDSVPELTASAIAKLGPTGVKRADGDQLLAIGGVAAPDDLEGMTIAATDPAEIADQVDKRRAKLSGKSEPDNILVASSGSPEYAMPAAAWAARSGDPVVFADGDAVPKATLAVLDRHPDASVYVLGPKDVITDKALDELSFGGRKPVRVGAEGPVENAIEFARFSDGSFGWNINDPGHGFVIANTSLPGDAGAAAALSAAGKPGPLLLTDDAAAVPAPLRAFLLDTKPGYVDDPTRAIYNHVWLIGDEDAISIPFQAEVDTLTELAKVSEDSGAPDLGPSPGKPESDPGDRLLP